MKKKPTIVTATTPASPSSDRPWPHGASAPRETIRMRITPEIAREWLLANTRNRPLNRTKLAAIIADMKGGRFVYVGDLIKFSWSPETGWLLANGQHRLIASVETGVSFEEGVAIINHDARKHVDTGRSCNAPQAWMRETGEHLSKTDVGRINAAWQGLRGGPPRTAEEWGRARALFADGLTAMSAVFAAHRTETGRAPYVAAFMVAYRVAPARVMEAARAFERGVGYADGDPVYVLRRWAAEGEGRKASAPVQFSCALNLVVSHIDGKPRKIPRTDDATIARFRKLFGLDG